MQRGEIYLASFPFGDVPGMKLRPVLLLTPPIGKNWGRSEIVLFTATACCPGRSGIRSQTSRSISSNGAILGSRSIFHADDYRFDLECLTEAVATQGSAVSAYVLMTHQIPQSRSLFLTD